MYLLTITLFRDLSSRNLIGPLFQDITELTYLNTLYGYDAVTLIGCC